jgi:hypothetical protein
VAVHTVASTGFCGCWEGVGWFTGGSSSDLGALRRDAGQQLQLSTVFCGYSAIAGCTESDKTELICARAFVLAGCMHVWPESCGFWCMVLRPQGADRFLICGYLLQNQKE